MASRFGLSVLRVTRMKGSHDVVDGFRMRGREVTRLESFADAIFAFALTLLIVSLEVPKSFADLIGTMRGFPAFAVCFVMLASIWNTHYKFSRRFGLDDPTTRFLTCILLFIVLFYVYPLKFLFTLGINDMIFGRSVPGPVIKQSDLATLFSIYSFGFAGIYLAFTLLYLHAWRLRDVLDLSQVEKLETRYIIYRVLAVAVVGLMAAGLALMPWFPSWGGLIYLLLVPILRGFRIVHRRQRAALLPDASHTS
ncbi:MAG TPA: TMEM175 family protein [Candidatus Udaeobacter sp.]|nr:TMEM175 family protein [Candidatus Udaeobacter sp.]